MVAGDQDNRGIGECVAKPLELPERKDDGVIGGPDRVKEIPGDDYRVRLGGNDTVNGGAEGLGDIGFALVDAGRSLPVVLPDAEVGVCDVGQFHGWRMGLKAVKSKNFAHQTAPVGIVHPLESGNPAAAEPRPLRSPGGRGTR